MTIKCNQPSLLSAIKRLLEHCEGAAPATEVGIAAHRVNCVGDRAAWPSLRCATTCEVGHGRVERRTLKAVSIPANLPWLTWPGQQQVFAVQRETHDKKQGRRRCETVYGISSLNVEQADAAALLKLVRNHWQIENGLHWVRDVTFDEDRFSRIVPSFDNP